MFFVIFRLVNNEGVYIGQEKLISDLIVIIMTIIMQKQNKLEKIPKLLINKLKNTRK